MKKILVILILLPLLAQAQEFQRDTRWLKLGMYTGSIMADAAGDAFMNTGRKDLGHAMQAASVGILLTLPFVAYHDRGWRAWLVGAGSYGFMRFALFDYTYNWAAGLPWDYQGTTSGYDRVVNQWPARPVAFAKAVGLTVGISLTLNYGQ